MPSCCVFACKKRSETSSMQKDNVTFHLFPKSSLVRDAWVQACGNHGTWAPKRTSTVCSLHFEPSLFILQANNKRKLKAGAVPTLMVSEKNCCAAGTHTLVYNTEESTAAASRPIYEVPLQAPSDSEDPGSPAPEIPVTVKLEVEEDAFSEHEEDVEEQLENRKRMLEKDPIAVEEKRVKVELDAATQSVQQPQYEILVQPQTSQVQPQFLVVNPQQSQVQSQLVVLTPPSPQSKCSKPAAQTQRAENEPLVVPEFFMNTVVQNQTEILKILKQQVLLPDPDPQILTFLRFLGFKLLRLPKKKRNKLQEKITHMVMLEKEHFL